MKRFILLILMLAMSALSASSAHAQTPIAFNHSQKPIVVGKAEFRFAFAPPSVPRPLQFGSSLIPVEVPRHNSGAKRTTGVALVAAGSSLQVLGSGTLGRLTKWIGLTSSNALIGDTTIFESKTGQVGIGTEAPTSRLTVAGTIEALSGGFKFPDGTVQTTAGVAPNQVVRSLNGLMGDLSLVPGPNITITPGANSLTIAASGLLGAVSHDPTLRGSGTSGSPLGVNIPLILNGSTFDDGVIQATNTELFGTGVLAHGGNGGDGLHAQGGSGGKGVDAQGGSGSVGGDGLLASGGTSSSFNGGAGVRAFGGNGHSLGNSGGIGIEAFGGLGMDGAAQGLAGKFQGDVEVNGTLSAATKNFKIDHPLDPENKFLYHTSVESPDMKNIYDGYVITDGNGEATVTLPAYFEALNRDFRYQLTVIGQFAQAIIADEIKDNRFLIKTNAANVKVSWQVTGIRKDAYANQHRIKVEEVKSEKERGYFLHPEAFGQPAERGLEWARHPELMRQMKERREQLKQRKENSAH